MQLLDYGIFQGLIQDFDLFMLRIIQTSSHFSSEISSKSSSKQNLDGGSSGEKLEFSPQKYRGEIQMNFTSFQKNFTRHFIKTSSPTSSDTSLQKENVPENDGDEEFSDEDLASLRDLVAEEETPSGKPLPRRRKEIPGYLYNEGSKQYNAAWLYVVENERYEDSPRENRVN